MKVLLVRGNPRKTGVCERLADIFVDGLIAGGADVFDFDTTTAKISHCKGCLTCNFGEVGRCVIGDDMLEVCDYLSSADALICVSPVYFYAMSSQMKMFFDRCFPFVRGYSYNADLQRNENHLSFKKTDKKFLTISVASGRLGSSFSAMSQTYKTIAQALGLDYCADIKRGESVYFSGLGDDSVRVGKVLSAFRKAGETFAKTGNIENALIDQMEMELAPNDEIFSKRAKVFWELSKHQKVGERETADLKVALRKLAKKMQNSIVKNYPEKIFSIKYSFLDIRESFLVSIDSQKYKVEKMIGQCSADVEIRLTSTLFYDIIANLRDISSAIKSQKLTYIGDSYLFSLFADSVK
jgi:multimeric flavodoxin WrbA